MEKGVLKRIAFVMNVGVYVLHNLTTLLGYPMIEMCARHGAARLVPPPHDIINCLAIHVHCQVVRLQCGI